MLHKKYPSATKYVVDKLQRGQQTDVEGRTYTVFEGVGIVMKKADYYIVVIAGGVNRFFNTLVELVDHILVARGYQ
jgi:hypothetical protein